MSEPLRVAQNPQEFRWSARARWLEDQRATVYTRNLSFTVEKQASFRETDRYPSAVEYLLGALVTDLINGFVNQATRQGLMVDAVEARITGFLSNPLVYLGVIGEEGHPGLEEIECRLYVSAEADEEVLQQIWQVVQKRSPVLNTLSRGVRLNLALKTVL